MNVAGFDWDEGNRDKCQIHGVSIAEIEAVISGDPRIVPDLKHSQKENRFIAIGAGSDDRPLFVAFRFSRAPWTAADPSDQRTIHACKGAPSMARKVPRLTSDEAAERFLDQDLSDLDFSQFKPARFEFEPKSERINMRLPKTLLEAVKASAAAEGIPYQRYIRQTLERALTGTKS